MANSALVGQPPANQRDKDIIEGFWRFINRSYGPGGPPHSSIIPKKPDPSAPGGVNGNVVGKDIAIFTVVTILILLLSGTRLWVRAFKRNLKWGPDDWAMVAATILLLGVTGSWFASIPYAGIGKHIWNITYQQYQNYFTYLTINQEFFYTGVGVVKISICLFNRRLTGLSSKAWMIYHNVLLVLLVLYCLTSILTQAIMCVPTWSFMNFAALGRRTTATHCMDSDKLAKALGFAHAAFDIVLVPVPLIVLYRIQMNRVQKVKMMLLFSVGLLSMVSAIVRNTEIHRSAKKDSTYYTVTKTWLIVDIMSGLACANLPILHSLLPTPWRKGLSRASYNQSRLQHEKHDLEHGSGSGSSSNPISSNENEKDGGLVAVHSKAGSSSDESSTRSGKGGSGSDGGGSSATRDEEKYSVIESRRAQLEGYEDEEDIATNIRAKVKKGRGGGGGSFAW